MELYLCSEEQFQYFSDTMLLMLEAAAAKADQVKSLREGDVVLACEDQAWYRAIVTKVCSAEDVEVELVDLALTTTIGKDKLRTASHSVTRDPVVAVCCCLASWENEDKDAALEKWGGKLEVMLEQYSEVQVDVL